MLLLKTFQTNLFSLLRLIMTIEGKCKTSCFFIQNYWRGRGGGVPLPPPKAPPYSTMLDERMFNNTPARQARRLLGTTYFNYGYAMSDTTLGTIKEETFFTR